MTITSLFLDKRALSRVWQDAGQILQNFGAKSDEMLNTNLSRRTKKFIVTAPAACTAIQKAQKLAHMYLHYRESDQIGFAYCVIVYFEHFF
jgi:hypothetical protein